MGRGETGDSEGGQIARPKLWGRDGAVRYTQASRAKEALWEDNELVVHCESNSTRRRQCHVYKAFDMDGD